MFKKSQQHTAVIVETKTMTATLSLIIIATHEQWTTIWTPASAQNENFQIDTTGVDIMQPPKTPENKDDSMTS